MAKSQPAAAAAAVDVLGSKTNCVLHEARGTRRFWGQFILQDTLGLAEIMLLADGLGRNTNNVLHRG